MSLKEAIQILIEKENAVVGFAPINRFSNLKENHPHTYLESCNTVIVIGLRVPKDIYKTAPHSQQLVNRANQVTFDRVDLISHKTLEYLEQQGATSLPMPAYIDCNTYLESAEIFSLSNAAIEAGLGARGKNGLVYHKKWGAHVRYTAIFTDVKLEADKIQGKSPCPDSCTTCIDLCPSQSAAAEFHNKERCTDFNKGKSIASYANPTHQNFRVGCFLCTVNCPLNKVTA